MVKVTFWYRVSLPEYHSIENLFDKLIEKWSNQSKFNYNKLHVPKISSSLKNVFTNILFAIKNSSNINHVTGDIYYITPFLKGKKIVTIHDFVLMRRPANRIKKILFKYLWYVNPIKYADIITVISPKIKNELFELVPNVNTTKIKVIPNFYNPYYDEVRKLRLNELIFESSALFIGVTENKNLSNSILALVGLNITLHIVGKPSNNDVELLLKHKVQYVLHENISLEQLGYLYQTTSFLLYPSLYEGFGLPIIEAQAVGLPVITSNIEPLNWVAGDAAILINPTDVESIRNGIYQILEKSSDSISKMIKLGFQNIERFNIESVSKQYLDLYSA